ncbi:hypothetical protein HaLaN_00917 [Haematococcus lacustris]|uniref:Uncharacterized protein n=1 Tax=Haematococcus lacustris TaxID=44745 RepID=A0A699YEP9_HAELA|nr:hypothetical protein HaLaN_00917 [Haematococcus lacustris]
MGVRGWLSWVPQGHQGCELPGQAACQGLYSKHELRAKGCTFLIHVHGLNLLPVQDLDGHLVTSQHMLRDFDLRARISCICPASSLCKRATHTHLPKTPDAQRFTQPACALAPYAVGSPPAFAGGPCAPWPGAVARVASQGKIENPWLGCARQPCFLVPCQLSTTRASENVSFRDPQLIYCCL